MTSLISIIIVAYNSNDVLFPCLESLEKFNPVGKSLEVVVVDNYPVVGLDKLIADRKWNFEVKYRANAKNDGFGGGNNRGTELASAPVLLFLNPDTILVEDIVTPTLKMIDNNPDEVVGYSLTDIEGNPNNSFSYFPEYLLLFPLLHALERISPLAFVNGFRILNRIAWPWGAAFALRKDRFEEAGLFDENIFLCNEEPDLMHRLPRRHLTILKNNIIHLEGHGREVPISRYLAYLKSLDYYFKKHRVASAHFVWKIFAFKQFVKKLLRRGAKSNLDLAYELFLNNK